MSTPLVSVVIPTFNRPQFLPWAVESALTCQGEDVEVIVVPNGPDQSWRESLAPWISEPRVRVSPIETAHGNAARNYGMDLARGKFLRFLDDDDYLLPAAARQIELLERDGAEICSGYLLSKDKEGSNLGRVSFPNTQDFICAATIVSGIRLPVGNVYLRSALSHSRWDTAVNRAQDYAWMLDLATQREWRWVHLEEDVGVWFQHDQRRTSSVASFTDYAMHLVSRLTSLNETLLRTTRHTPARLRAIADSLWCYVHIGFPYHPIHWSRVARQACNIDPASGPPDPLFQTGVFHSIHPILGEWLLLPIRKVTRTLRDMRADWQGRDYRRQL